jgi:hypothetical protein
VKKTLAGESRTADTETVDDWKNDRLMEETKEYDLCDIYTNVDETRLFLSLQPSMSYILWKQLLWWNNQCMYICI